MKTANEARAETAEARKKLSEERMARVNKFMSDNDVSGKSMLRLPVATQAFMLAWKR